MLGNPNSSPSRFSLSLHYLFSPHVCLQSARLASHARFSAIYVFTKRREGRLGRYVAGGVGTNVVVQFGEFCKYVVAARIARTRALDPCHVRADLA